MTKFIVLSIFPEMFTTFLETSIIKRAIEANKVSVEVLDIRDFSKSKNRKVDDTPYGGGSGMVMMCQPLDDAIKFATEKLELEEKTKCEKDNLPYNIIYLSPRGKLLTHNVAKTYANNSQKYILICGHYEGIDERILQKYNITELSIGDFVLTGGELPAMIFMDCVIRLKPTVLSEGSLDEESHTNILLEYSQYTKPSEYDNMLVPDVLLSGHHKKISEYRRKSAILNTHKNRPELITKALQNNVITCFEIDEIIKEKGGK